MYWSDFTRYMNENKGLMPKSTYTRIRNLGIARYTERVNAGYGSEPLDFSDLINEAEKSVAPR